ncbi:hypothetical protein CR513_34939, partial [Mucuna pruriens]
MIRVAKEHCGLYYLQHTKIGNNINKEELSSNQQATSETWAASQIWLYHKCLGHLLFGLLKIMFSHLFTKESIKSFKCDVCQFSKCYCATFSLSNNKSFEPSDVIHSNMWEPTSNSISRVKWFVSLRSDNGTKFVNLEFTKFLKDNCVVHKLTKNRHLLEVAKAPLFQMFVPNVYWRKVVLTATYLINRLPTRVLNGISQIKHMLSFFPSSPLMLSLPSRVFECVAFVHSHNPHCRKLDLRVVKCVFIGYPSNKKDVQAQVQVQEVMKPTLVLEQVQMSKSNVSIPDNSIEEQVQLSKLEVSIPNNSIEDVTDDMSIALRKGKRSCVNYLFLNLYVLTISLYNIKLLLLPLITRSFERLELGSSNERRDEGVEEKLNLRDC